MSCNITSGITTGCNTGIGGVKTVWLANGINEVLYEYEMDKETASLVETYNVNQAGSILGFTQTLTIQLNKMAADKQQQIALIAQANGMYVRVLTNDDSLFEFGIERGAYLASGTTTSGTAYTDTNQSELVIQADSKEPMQGGVEFMGQVFGNAEYLSGCTNEIPTGGAYRMLRNLSSPDGKLEFRNQHNIPDPTYNTNSEIKIERGYWYKFTYWLTGSYNAYAFSDDGIPPYGPSQAQYVTAQMTIGSTMDIYNEPTVPFVESTWRLEKDNIATSASIGYEWFNFLESWTTKICQETTSNERKFTGPVELRAIVTRRPR